MPVRGVKLVDEVLGDSGPWIVISPGGRRGLASDRAPGVALAEAGMRVLLCDRRNTGASEIGFPGQSESHEQAEDLLSTMNMLGAAPYGPSKAALEMATEVWAKELAGTGVTVNIVNPGAGANTPGMAQEMRDRSASGKAARLVEPDEMVAPMLFVVSREADRVNGYRFDANTWRGDLAPAASASLTGRKAGFEFYPISDCFAS
jgi:hypothetical protein